MDARHGRTLYASAAFSKSGAAASQSGLSLKSSKLGDQYCMHKGRHNKGALHLAAGVELVFNRCDLQPYGCSCCCGGLDTLLAFFMSWSASSSFSPMPRDDIVLECFEGWGWVVEAATRLRAHQHQT